MRRVADLNKGVMHCPMVRLSRIRDCTAGVLSPARVTGCRRSPPISFDAM
jgi:hypothetical protein